MSMINCPECGAKISDRALSCTQCGFCGEDKNLPISVQYDSDVVRIAVIKDNDENPIIISDLDYMDFESTEKWRDYKLFLPASTEAIKSLVGNKELVAVIDKKTKEMLQNGELNWAFDKSGYVLPALRKNGKIFKQVRLETRTLSPNFLSSMVNLAMQIQLSEMMNKIESIEKSIYFLHIEMQEDRYAFAESAWDELEQAKIISDKISRKQAIFDAVRSATKAKRVLMGNYKIKNCKINEISKMKRRKKAKEEKEIESTAKEAIKVLLYIFRTVQTECEGYLILNETKSYLAVLKEFNEFIEKTPINKDSLIRINECLTTNEIKVVDDIYEIVEKVQDIHYNQDALEQKTTEELTDDVKGGEDND